MLNDFILFANIGILVLGLFYFKRIVKTTYSQYGFIFIWVGCASNLIDRILLGKITDFIFFIVFHGFNVADIYISTGMVLFLLEFIFIRFRKVGIDHEI